MTASWKNAHQCWCAQDNNFGALLAVEHVIVDDSIGADCWKKEEDMDKMRLAAAPDAARACHLPF